MRAAALLNRVGKRISHNPNKLEAKTANTAAMPIRIPSAESQLSGQTIDDPLLDETADVLSAAIQPLTDVRSTEFYRKQVSQILFKDTFAKAWNRAGKAK